MEKTTKAPIQPGGQDTAIEAQSRNLPRDVYELHGRSSIIPELRNQKEQADSPQVEVLRSDGPDHLSSDERNILQHQLSMPSVKVSYTMLYRYATKTDIFILIVSAICAIVSGATMPLMTVCTGIRRMKLMRLATKTNSRLFSANWQAPFRSSSWTLSQTLNSTIYLVNLHFTSYTLALESS
jgi:hypothetical protein